MPLPGVFLQLFHHWRYATTPGQPSTSRIVYKISTWRTSSLALWRVWKTILPNGMFLGHISTAPKDPFSAKNANLQLQVCQNSASICGQHTQCSWASRNIGFAAKEVYFKKRECGIKTTMVDFILVISRPIVHSVCLQMLKELRLFRLLVWLWNSIKPVNINYALANNGYEWSVSQLKLR